MESVDRLESTNVSTTTNVGSSTDHTRTIDRNEHGEPIIDWSGHVWKTVPCGEHVYYILYSSTTRGMAKAPPTLLDHWRHVNAQMNEKVKEIEDRVYADEFELAKLIADMTRPLLGHETD